MATPIILKITEAGKNAILDSENTGLTLRLSHLAIGSGQYTPTGLETALQGEISRHGIVSGNVEPQSHTLRFSSSITSDNEIAVYEIGLMTENNVLFAVASTIGNPLLKVYPDITFVASFGLTLDEFDISKITVVNDPNGALSIVLMQQHLASPDPHPQYALRKYVNEQIDILLNRPFEGIPVWGILTTTKHYNNGDEVTADLRYGKWARYAQGKVLAGYSLLATDIAEYKTMGNEFGANTETLTIEQMPNHNHGVNISGNIGGDGNLATDNRGSVQNGLISTNTGGNQPHNNLQPSVVTAFWVRMPNDYTAPIYEMFWTTDSDGNNRITSTGENQALYLWLTAQNMAQSMAIGVSMNADNNFTTNEKADFSYPNSIGNGKHRLAYLPADSYVATANTTLNMGVTMADGTALSAPLGVNDTVDNTPVATDPSMPVTPTPVFNGGFSIHLIQLTGHVSNASGEHDYDIGFDGTLGNIIGDFTPVLTITAGGSTKATILKCTLPQGITKDNLIIRQDGIAVVPITETSNVAMYEDFIVSYQSSSITVRSKETYHAATVTFGQVKPFSTLNVTLK